MGKYKKDIHDLDTKLRESRVYLEQEYDSDKCLGVTLECNKKTVLIEMLQYGIIDRIVEELVINDGMVMK